MEINNQVFEWIAILKTRPKMIIAEQVIDFRILKTYIEGYIDGLGHAFNKNIRKDITQFFQKKVNEQSSIYWTDHIHLHYKNKNDEELKLILLEMTEQYFQENPDWNKNK